MTNVFSGIRIRTARADELALLPEIEARAGRRFQQVAELVDAPADLTPLAELEVAHSMERVWVAVSAEDSNHDEVIGFAYAAVLDDLCHLEEVDVLPEYGQRGIGAALVRTVCRYATDANLRGVSLTTYRDVPWNAPFYRRLGFEPVDRKSLPSALATAVDDEARRGLDPDQRIVMMWRTER